MAMSSSQQIEEELWRVLKLNQNQLSANSRQPKGGVSVCVSGTSSLSVGDVEHAPVASPRVASLAQNDASAASSAGPHEKIASASSSSPSINTGNVKQSSPVNETGARRHRKPRRSKQNSPRYTSQDTVGVTGTGSTISGSSTASAVVKPGTPQADTSVMNTANTVSAEICASSAVPAGMSTSGSGSGPATVPGMNSATNVKVPNRTSTDQRGGRAPRGRGFAKHTDVSASTALCKPLQKPKSDDRVCDANTSHAMPSKQSSSTGGNIAGKSESAMLPTADENVTDLLNAPADKIVQNSVKPPIKKQETGKSSIDLLSVDFIVVLHMWDIAQHNVIDL